VIDLELLKDLIVEVIQGQEDLFLIVPFGLIEVPDLVLDSCQ
jgi:hypothetical protein